MADDLVCVKTFTYRYEAEMAQSLLESSDIPSFVSADDAGGTNPFLLTSTGGAQLIVRRKDAEKALSLLEASPEEQNGLTDEPNRDQ